MIRLFLIYLLMSSQSFAKDIACYIDVDCTTGARTGNSNPSTGNQIRINPSAVPTKIGYGLEAIYFNSATDFSIVQGMGRIGAALSPSNSDETFFGTPGFEISENLLDRKRNDETYPTQKINLAAAFIVAEKNRDLFNSYALKIGFMGKYNKLTRHTNLGAGLSGVAGPMTFGFSTYQDETRLDYSITGSNQVEDLKYRVNTYSLGLSVNSLLVDISKLSYEDPQNNSGEVSSVRIITVSWNYKRLLFTTANRLEDSNRLYYDSDSDALITRQYKNGNFYALQYIASYNFTLGVLHNYYLLNDTAVTATIFY